MPSPDPAAAPGRRPATSTPAASAVPAPSADAIHQPTRALIIGGGPDRAHNQVAIESNVRYVGRLLPATTSYRVLFTDGNLQSDTVQFQGEGRSLVYRAPDLPRLDAGTDLPAVRTALSATVAASRASHAADVVLYFTGHGAGDRPSNFANNWFALWNGGRFTVRELAASIEAFPADTPVTLIMVQCYSGAFGNVQFQGGDPQGAVLERNLAGFFAALPDRTAAGCTPAINEANYRDFTSYFFAALTGEDRMGRPVSGADFNGDARVGMDEAFAWSLVHDDSIDTPVCTSDTFVRRFASVPDAEIAALPFTTMVLWASPAQRAALQGLSDVLGLTSDDRLGAAFERFGRMRPTSTALPDVRLLRFVNLARSIALAHAVRTSGDEPTKRRLAELLQAESRNPIR